MMSVVMSSPRVELCRHALASAYPGNFLGAVARLLSSVLAEPNLVSISGCPSAILQTFDQCELFKHTVQFPFRFEVVSSPRLMHQKYERFLGKIDFFSQLKYLVVFVNDSLDQVWMLECPNLSKVIFFLFCSELFSGTYIGSNFTLSDVI